MNNYQVHKEGHVTMELVSKLEYIDSYTVRIKREVNVWTDEWTQ
jgi:hypothetical protein